MTPKRIKELRKLCDGATPGPWKARQLTGFGPMRFIITESEKSKWHQVVAILENPGSFDGDKFIAASRTALPEALDEIDKLRTEIEQLKGKKKAKKSVKKVKKNITKKKVVKKLKKKPTKKITEEPIIRETNPKLPDYRAYGIVFGKIDLVRWRFVRIRANRDELVFGFSLIKRKQDKLSVMYHQRQGVTYRSLRKFATDLVDKSLFDEEPGIEGRFRGMSALIVDRNEIFRGRVHCRRIFFRTESRWCCFKLQGQVDSFNSNLVEFDEVLKAIWTS